VHHYGKLDKERAFSKGEEYYRLGKKKLAEKEKVEIKAVDELAVQAAVLGRYEEALEYLEKLRRMHFLCTDYFSDFAKKIDFSTKT
jgi:hypothetical protein